MGKNELLIYGLLFGVFLLFNYFMQQVARRARERQEREQAAQAHEAARPPEDESLEYLWGRKPDMDLPVAAAHVEPAPRVPAIAAAPGALPRRIASSALFRSREDLRRAVVVMTVLGPCRALEPYDRHQGGPAEAPPNRS